mmetsp:Transcript_519/g.777  ORF Transcript_519/g.777 Transcript_519/m.777 type:complete len:146 (-) Transcript_519:716-1153(-)
MYHPGLSLATFENWEFIGSNNPNMCKTCKMQFQDPVSLSLHSRSHEVENRPHKCEKCNKRFEKERDLSHHHRRGHDKSRAVKCSNCSKLLSSKQSLKAHVAIHLDERPWKCPLCEYHFRAQSNVYSHLRYSHKTAMRRKGTRGIT